MTWQINQSAGERQEESLEGLVTQTSAGKMNTVSCLAFKTWPPDYIQDKKPSFKVADRTKRAEMK